MFPDFSGLGDGMKSLNEKFDMIIALLQKIESNTRKPNLQEMGLSVHEERRYG